MIIVVLLILTIVFSNSKCYGKDVLESIDEISASDSESIFEKSNELMERFNISNLLSEIYSNVRNAFSKYGKTFGVLIFITFLSGIINTLVEDKAMCFASVLLVCTSTFSVLATLCENIQKVMNSIENFMLSILPMMTTLYSASSAPVTGASSYTSTVMILNICSAVFTKIILPAVRCVAVFSTVTLVSSGFDFSGFSKFIKSIVSKMFGLILCVMSASIYFQTVISVSKDGIASRAVRYAAANVIPVIGTVVSESARTVSESLKLVRSVGGTAGILAIIGIISAPIIAITVSKFFFQLCSCIAKLTGSLKIGMYYDEISEALNMLLGACIGVCLVLVLILGIFAKTTVTV